MPADKSQKELELESEIAVREETIRLKDAEILSWREKLDANDRARRAEKEEAEKEWISHHTELRLRVQQLEQAEKDSLPLAAVQAREAELLSQIEQLKGELREATAGTIQKESDHANAINNLQAEVEAQHRERGKVAEEKEAVSRRNGELEAEATYARGYAELVAAMGVRTLVEALEWIQERKGLEVDVPTSP